jgi:hypothetical protein
MDEAGSWDNLHERFEVKRINHQEAYSMDDACMTEGLASKTCPLCRGGIPPLTREQAEFFQAQAPDWQLPEQAHRIGRTFRFRNLRQALTFLPNIRELTRV